MCVYSNPLPPSWNNKSPTGVFTHISRDTGKGGQLSTTGSEQKMAYKEVDGG